MTSANAPRNAQRISKYFQFQFSFFSIPNSLACWTRTKGTMQTLHWGDGAHERVRPRRDPIHRYTRSELGRVHPAAAGSRRWSVGRCSGVVHIVCISFRIPIIASRAQQRASNTSDNSLSFYTFVMDCKFDATHVNQLTQFTPKHSHIRLTAAIDILLSFSMHEIEPANENFIIICFIICGQWTHLVDRVKRMNHNIHEHDSSLHEKKVNFGIDWHRIQSHCPTKASENYAGKSALTTVNFHQMLNPDIDLHSHPYWHDEQSIPQNVRWPPYILFEVNRKVCSCNGAFFAFHCCSAISWWNKFAESAVSPVVTEISDTQMESHRNDEKWCEKCQIWWHRPQTNFWRTNLNYY